MKSYLCRTICCSLLLGALQFTTCAADPPKPGEKAPDFSLKTLDDQSVRLSDFGPGNRVVLVVLRGWPGYQCPICTTQVQDYIANSAGFSDAKARVIMVYPGPVADLRAHAKDFLNNKQWPKEFSYLLDPNFTMVEAYGLRWNAAAETAFPSTFIIDGKGVVQSAKISRSHGGRTKASEVLKELKRSGSG